MTLTYLKSFGAMSLIALGLAAAGAGIAVAEQNGSETDMAEAQAFLTAPGSIAEAIAAAEKNTGGKAMSASFETDQSTATSAYEVEVALPDGTMSTVMVDPANGTVTAKAAEAEEADGTGMDNGESEDGENESN